MVSSRGSDRRVTGRLSRILAVVLSVGVAAVAHRSERAYERWSAKTSPLVGLRARLEEMKAARRARREFASDLAYAVGDLFVGTARATAEPGHAAVPAAEKSGEGYPC